MTLKVNSTNLFKSTTILGKGTQRLKKSSSNINRSLQKNSIFKRQSISKRKNIYAQRMMSINRRRQRDIVEVSRVTGTRKNVGQIVRDSNKGFFGRILEVVGYALVGWTVQNLPKITMMANKLAQQLPKLTNLLSSFMTTSFSVFQEIGNLSSALVRSLLAFDFNSMGRQIQLSLSNLSNEFEKLENDLYEGMKIFAEVFNIDENKPQNQNPPPTVPPSGIPPGSPSPTNQRGNYGNPGQGAVRQYAANQGYSSTFTAGLLATIDKESTFNPYAIGDSGRSYGLFQFGGTRRTAFLNFLSANGIPNPFALFQYPNGPSAKKYRNKVFGLTLEYMMENEEGAQLVRDYKNSNDLRTIMGGFEDIERYSGNQKGTPRNQRNNTKYRERLEAAQAYLRTGANPQPQPPRPAPTPGPNVPFTVPQLNPNLKYQKGGVLTGTIGRGVPYVQIGDVIGAPRPHGPHQGIDIFAPTGTFIALRVTGKVLFAGWQNSNDHLSGYGLMVDMWVPELGVQLRFGHCDQLLCSTGNTIKAGQSFATVGHTGNANPKNNDGSHIHFEFSRKYNDTNYGTVADPSPYIPFLILSAVRLNGSNASTNTNNRRNLAQIAPAGTNLNNVESITPSYEGETLYITVPPQAYQTPAMVGGSGGGSIIIPSENSLNSLMKQRILMELAYT